MIRPCPNPECSKPVIVPLDVLAEAMSGGGKQLTCSRCGDVLWLSKNGVLKSVSGEYREIKQRDLEVLSVEKERCVILSCGKETPYTKNTPINERKYYARGVGQLCEKCGGKYYPEV